MPYMHIFSALHVFFNVNMKVTTNNQGSVTNEITSRAQCNYLVDTRLGFLFTSLPFRLLVIV